MAPGDAGSRAWHVGEDPVERAPVPPVLEAGAIAGAHARDEPQARERVLDALAAARLSIQGEKVDIGELEDVRRLSARRRACVEDSLAVAKIHQGGSALRAEILHGDLAR